MDKDIYELQLHEESIIEDNGITQTIITRVPGGWIYTFSFGTTFQKTSAVHSKSSVFVPFSTEFGNRQSVYNNPENDFTA